MSRVAWNGEPEWRTEVCELRLTDDGLTATGAQLGAQPRPYRAAYELEARVNWVTRRLRVEVAGVGTLELRHDGKGFWAGVPNSAELEGVLDCDLAFSPLTNTMPIRRHRLHQQPGDGRLRDGVGVAARSGRAPLAAALRAPRAGEGEVQLGRLRGRPRARLRRPRGGLPRACAPDGRVEPDGGTEQAVCRPCE